MSISERKKEINARRKRRETLRKMKSELPKADAAKKAVWAAKLRKMTPGAEASSRRTSASPCASGPPETASTLYSRTASW